MSADQPRSIRRYMAIAVALALLGACTAESDNAPAPEPAPPPVEPAATQPLTVDLDAIFPAGPGRDLVLNNCQTCHVWVPIVILQMDEAAWYRNSLNHRGRVEALSDEEFETLYAYLSSTFTPDRPVPQLPPSLLEAWTSN